MNTSLTENRKTQLHWVKLTVSYSLVLSLGLALTWAGICDATAATTGGLRVSLSQTTLVPFDIITIKGRNFDTTAATSVAYQTKRDGVITVPVMGVSPTAIKVMVPPVGYNPYKARFTPTFAKLQVIQVRESGDKLVVSTSKLVKGLWITSPRIHSAIKKPAVRKRLRKGAITSAFVSESLASIQTAAAKVSAGDTQVLAAFAQAEQSMAEVLAAVETIKQNPDSQVSLQTNKGDIKTLTVDGVAWLDAYYAGLAGMMEKRLATKTAALMPLMSLVGAGRCNQEDPDLRKLMAETCDLNSQVDAQREKAARFLPEAAKIAYGYLFTPVQAGLGVLVSGASTVYQIAVPTLYSLVQELLVYGKAPDATATLYTVAGSAGDVLTDSSWVSTFLSMVQLNGLVADSFGVRKPPVVPSATDTTKYVKPDGDGYKVYAFAKVAPLKSVELLRTGISSGGYEDIGQPSGPGDFSFAMTGSGGTPGEVLGSVSGCGATTTLSLDDTIQFSLDYDSTTDLATARIIANVYTPDYGSGSYRWEGPVIWDGSRLNGPVPRSDLPSRPPAQLVVTLGSDGQYRLNATLPFTYYIYLLDGSCTGPLATFNYQVNNVLLSGR